VAATWGESEDEGGEREVPLCRNGYRTEPDRREPVETSGEMVFKGGDVVDDRVLSALVVGAHIGPVVEH
jgi:hypothetical protein